MNPATRVTFQLQLHHGGYLYLALAAAGVDILQDIDALPNRYPRHPVAYRALRWRLAWLLQLPECAGTPGKAHQPP